MTPPPDHRPADRRKERPAAAPEPRPTTEPPRADKIEQARQAMRRHEYDSDEVLERTVRRIVDALRHADDRPS